MEALPLSVSLLACGQGFPASPAINNRFVFFLLMCCCTFFNCRVSTQELVDYFFYALLRTQGEDTTEERSTASVVPVAEIPNIMRALGYYPTEQVGFRKFLLKKVCRWIGACLRWKILLSNNRTPVSRVFILCMGEGKWFASMGRQTMRHHDQGEGFSADPAALCTTPPVHLLLGSPPNLHFSPNRRLPTCQTRSSTRASPRPGR